MRKKSRRGNVRKFRFRSIFTRRRADDETEWIRFDEEPVAAKHSPRRRIRRRLLAARLIALACLSVSIPLALKWGYGEVFFKNEEFVLKSLQIQTDGNLNVTRLAEIANVSAGMNLMDLDLGQIQTRIETLPQVERATVTRELPDRLHLMVKERVPVAWLSVPPLGIRPWDLERGFLLDEEGHVFRCLDLDEGIKSLPVVEAFEMVEPEEGTKVASEVISAGVKLIVTSDARFLPRGLSVQSVRVRDEWALECTYSTALKATFGAYDFARGLDDLALILDRMADTGRTLSTVNLAAVKNIPVTFAAVESSTGAGNTAAAVPVPPVSQVTSAPSTGDPDSFDSDTSDSAQEKHLRSILKGG